MSAKTAHVFTRAGGALPGALITRGGNAVCHTVSAMVDRTVCGILLASARFTPALGGAGNYGGECKSCARMKHSDTQAPQSVSKESAGISSTAAVTSVEQLLAGIGDVKPSAGVDAVRLVSLVRAIETQGAGGTLSQWAERIMGWDAARVFDAIHLAMEKGWISR